MNEDEKVELGKQINKMVEKTLQRYLMVIVVIFIMIFGWHELRLAGHEKRMSEAMIELQDLKTDFGYSEGALHEKFPENLHFLSNFNRYAVRRGTVVE
jgi:uncharacterized membrane protein (DUF106 family)